MDHLQITKKEYRRFWKTGDSQYIYLNELDKACCQHDMTYGDFKDLARRTTSDKILHDKVFNIAKIAKYHGYQRGHASMVYKFFDKKTVAEELQKPIIWKFKKRKVQSRFIDNIWDADLADMQLIIKLNKRFRLLLCVIDIYGKYS